MSIIKSSSGHRAVAVTEVARSTTNPNAEIVEAQLSEAPIMSEILASSIKTSEADKSFAVEYSILDHAETRKLEYKIQLYVWTWPVMMLVSLAYALSIGFYRLGCLIGVVKAPNGETFEDRRRRLGLGPTMLTWAFWGHPLGKTVRHGVTTSAALDVIYATPRLLEKPKTIGERVVKYWLNQPDGQAVRNRLRITYAAAREELERLIAAGERRIRFLVLACGSAEASIKAVAHVQALHPEVDIQLTLVDLNYAPLTTAYYLAQRWGVADRVMIIQQKLQDFILEQGEEVRTWHIVEMVGFLDYRNPQSFNRTCAGIRSVLVPGGLFIAAGICPSSWSFVVRWVINWPGLIRRRPREIQAMLARSGFDQREPCYEPHNIHHVVLCRK